MKNHELVQASTVSAIWLLSLRTVMAMAIIFQDTVMNVVNMAALPK